MENNIKYNYDIMRNAEYTELTLKHGTYTRVQVKFSCLSF